MIRNYNSLSSGRDTWLKNGIGDLVGLPPGSLSQFLKRKWLVSLLMLAFMTIGQNVLAQSAANYTASTNTNGSLALDKDGNAIDMSTGTTQLYAGGVDSYTAVLTSIGFNFNFMGATYSQFSCNPDGQIRLGGTVISGHTQTAAAGVPYLIALNMDGKTDTTGKVHYKVQGTAPNRVLVVEWKDVWVYWSTTTTTFSTYQTRVYENGTVEYVYGRMFNNNSSAYSSSFGFSSSNTAGSIGQFITVAATPTYNTSSTSYTTTSFTASSSMTNLNSTADGSRRYFRFVPSLTTTPASPTSLTYTAVTASTTTPNWVDNSTDESYFIVTRANDAAFTTGVVTSVVSSTTIAGTGTTYTSAQTGLTPGTTYYYKIVAANEAGTPGTGLTGSQATSAGTTYYWVGPASAGLWSAAANWNTNPAGGGTARTAVATTDVLVVDGALTTAGAAVSISVDTTNFSIGQLQVTSGTACTLASSAATQRVITITGGAGDDFVIASGSSLLLTSTTNPISIVFSGTGNTGNIAGTLTVAGTSSTATAANSFLTTGGTGTVVTVASTGIINNTATTNITTNGNVTGSTATLVFANGSQYNVSGATTGAPWLPSATWGATSTVTISGLTTSSTAPTNAAQSFGNFVYNCPAATGNFNMWGSGTVTLQGDLTITATNTGSFRAVSSGTLTVNGNVNANGGTFSIGNGTSSTNGVIVLGNTTIGASGKIDLNAAVLSQRGTTFTNNGVLTGTATGSTLNFFSPTNAAQTFAGSGTVLTNIASIGVQTTGGLTITHTNQIPTLRVNLFNGTVTGSGKLTMGTGAALAVVTQTGYAGNTLAGGSFDVSPTFNLGTGTYSLIYAVESASRTTGFEIPATRTVSAITTTNANGIVLNGGNLSTAALTLGTGTGNITTNSSNVLRITGTATTAITRTSTTAYINGPLELTLPASLVSGSTYTFPIGKGTLNPFALVNPTTNAGGTVVVSAEVFDANAGGTSGSLMGALSTSRYWAASAVSGSANFTNSLVQLTDTVGTYDAIGASSTLTGAYDLQGGLAATVTGTSITTTAPALTSLPGFFLMGNKAAASLSSLTITPSGNLCTNASRAISVVVTPGGAAITGVDLKYQINGGAVQTVSMTNSTALGGLNPDTWEGTIPTVTPANGAITWSVVATDANALTKSATGTSYQDEPLFGTTAAATASPALVCNGSTTTLFATLSSPGTRTVGTGTTTAASGSTDFAAGRNFYGSYWGNARQQWLIRASELTAAGLSAGNLSSLSLTVAALGSPTSLTNFTIKLAQTTATTISGSFNTATATQVYTSASYTPVVGLNTHAFGTGAGSASTFAWDGTSNIIVDVCSANSVTGSTSATNTYTVPGYASGVNYGVDGSTGAGACTTTTVSYSTTARPNLNFAGQVAAPIASYSWVNNTTSTVVGTTNPLTVTPANGDTYTVTMSTSGGCSSTATTSAVTVQPLPSAPVATDGHRCGAGIVTGATVASGSGTPTPTFKWYAAATGGTALQTSTSASYTTSISTTTTLYVSEIVGTCESASRTPITLTVDAPPSLTVAVTSGNQVNCGVGTSYNVVLTATTSDPSMTYSWTASNGTAVINSGATSAVLDVNVTETTDFVLTGTPSDPTCNPIVVTFPVSVYPLPNATVTTTATGVCPGTSATINSGLSAGNFTSTAITHAPLAVPGTANVLVSGGVMNVTPDIDYSSAGDLDDSGWSAIPVGFNFNFFGTSYSTVNISTNGTVFFGTPNATSISDFTFTSLPSTTEPFNMVAVLAMDNNLAGTDGGTLSYWTTGTAPNRKFVINYGAVKEFGDTKYSTAQAIFYETLGVVEVHVTSSTNVDRNKLVGINNGNGTIGVLAYASGTTATATNPITTPFAYRFSPPANYTITWSSVGPGNVLTPIQTGTNIFSLSVSPSATTTYDLRYTNQTTGCSNIADSDRVTMTVIENTAPTATTLASASTICLNGTSVLTLNGAVNSIGNTDGLTYQWQVNTGSGYTNYTGTGATTASITVSPTVTSSYQCLVSVCGGSSAASTPVSVGFINNVDSVTGDTRCGSGTVNLSATTSSVGATLNWYAAATGGTALASGATYSPTVSATTTFYVAAETTGPACSSSRVPVIATVTAPPAITLTGGNSATICNGASTTLITDALANYDTFSVTPTTGAVSNGDGTFTFSPTATTVYTISASGFGCITSFTYTVNVNTANVTPAVNNSAICRGASVNLSATSTGYVPGASVAVGTGTSLTGDTTQPTAFCNRWPSYRMQMVYTAAELQAAGLAAGSITSMAFNIATLGDGATNDNFEVKMGTTTSSTLTAFESTTAYTTVYPAQTYTHTASGSQVIPFSTPFVWNGTSNVVVELIHNGADATNNSQTYYTSTTGNTVAYTSTSSSNSASLSTNRLNVVFVGVGIADNTSAYTYSWTSNPVGFTATGATATATPSVTTNYYVTATAPNGCSTTQAIPVTVNYDIVDNITGGQNTYCLGGSSQDYTFISAQTGTQFSSSNPAVATINVDTGELTLVGAGTTTIRAFINNTTTGCITYADADRVVTVYAPVAISSQPVSQSILDGGNTTFSVVAGGSLASSGTYQWQVSPNGINTWSDLSDAGFYSNTTTATLNITAADGSLDGLYYRCVVSGVAPCAATTPSNAAKLTVSTVAFTEHPALSSAVCGSGSRTFTVATDPSTASITWYYAPDGLSDPILLDGSDVDGMTFPNGVTGNSLQIDNITSANDGYYIYALADDTVGSNPAIIIAKDAPVVATTGVNAVQNVTVCANTAATSTFTVNSTPSTGVTYQWQYSSNGADWDNVSVGLPTGAITYNGAATATLTVGTSASLVAGPHYYRCRVTNSTGCYSDSNSAELIINTPTLNVTSSSSLICNPGGSAVTLTASGTATTYAWSPATGLSSTSGASVTANPTVTTVYTVLATEAGGCTRSAQITVTVGTVPVVPIVASQTTVCPGASVSLDASAVPSTGGSAPSYCAALNSGGSQLNSVTFNTLSNSVTQVTPFVDTYPATGATTTNVALGQTYTLSATTSTASIASVWIDYNHDGTFSSTEHTQLWTSASSGSVDITIPADAVTGPTGMRIRSRGTGSPNGPTDACTQFFSGTTQNYTIVIGSTDGFTYSWTSSPAGFISNTATVTVNPTETTTYSVLITNPTGCSYTATQTITAQTGANITSQPVASVVCNGANTSFSVVANGPDLTYQWYKDTVAITGNASATTATLTLNGVTTAVSGSTYYCVITPTCGATATSDTVSLTVNPTPTVTAPAAFPATCAGSVTSAIVLNGTPSGVTFDITGGSAVGLADQTGVTSIPSFTSIAGTATITITPKANGCTGSAITYTIAVNQVPTAVTVTPSSSSICSNDLPVLLTLSGGTVSNIQTVLGTGTSVNLTTSYPSPLSNYYGGAKHQMLVRASELTALGFVAGDQISAVQFNVNAVGSTFTGTLNDYSIAIGNTSNTVLNGTSFVSGLTTVRNAASVAVPTTGLPANLNIPFDAAFVWNGTSNIVIQTSYSNANSGTSSDYVQSRNSDPGFVSTNWYRADSVSAATILSATTPTSSGNARPNMVFTRIPSGATTYTWTSTEPNSFTDATGSSFSNTATGTSVYVRPGATATITATVAFNGCSNSGTSVITVTPATTWYADADGDGFGNAAVSQLACAQPSGYVANNTDCDDTNIAIYQLATYYVDADADGYTNGTASVCSGTSAPAGYSATSAGTDCNDNDATKYQTAMLYVDADGDGYTVGAATSVCYGATIPTGYSATSAGEDCDDTNALITVGSTFYADADGDGFGNAAVSTTACTAPSGYVSNNTDCDDTNISIYQLATFYVDADGDGWDNGTASVCSGTSAPAGYSATTSGTDCNDTNPLLTDNCAGGSVVNLTMFIQGYYMGGNTMNSVKFNQDFVSNMDEVEEITVELHDATTYDVVDTATGLLHTDGALSVTFNTAAAGDYFISVRGSNMVEIWSATAQTIGSTPLSYDFSADGAAYTDGSQASVVEVESGVFAAYSGDNNHDTVVDLSDYADVSTDSDNSAFGALATDLNGDGVVDLSDVALSTINSDASIYAQRPY